MSSSTSNSDKDPRGAEDIDDVVATATTKDTTRRWGAPWRIALTLVLFLFVLDVLVRSLLLPRSQDFINIHDFPQRAAALSRNPGRRLAIVGNSAVNAGVDPHYLMKALADHNLPDLHADVFPADDSRMVDWYCMVDRFFWESGNSVDILVLCFFNQSLADSRSSQTGRLAHWFATSNDWPILFDYCVTATADRADFLISTVWTSFAVRSRLRERTLELFVPDYKGYFRELNATQLLQQRSQAAQTPPARPSYHLLSSLLDRAAARHTRLIVVAFPRQPSADPTEDPQVYPLEQEAIRLIRAAGMDFIDMRRVDGLTRDKYLDFIHLTPEGKPIFTRALANRLAALLGKNPSPP